MKQLFRLETNIMGYKLPLNQSQICGLRCLQYTKYKLFFTFYSDNIALHFSLMKRGLIQSYDRSIIDKNRSRTIKNENIIYCN